MSTLSDNMKMKLLNFKDEKREQWEKERKLYAVHFEVTPRCNFHCVHCYLRDHMIELSKYWIYYILKVFFFLHLQVAKYFLEQILWIFICMQRERDL